MRAILDFKTTTDSRVYRHYVRYFYTGCDRCPPHRNENGHWRKPRKKKAFELDPKRRRK